MDLGEAVYRAIAGRSPRTEVASVGDAVEYFMRLAGGVASQAGRLAGVPASTFRAWTRGRQPKPERAGELVEAAGAMQRRARLPRGRERRLRAPGALVDMSMAATFTYDGRPRNTVHIGEYMDEGIQDELVNAYLDGASPDELGELFASGVVGSDFYERTLTAGQWDVTSVTGWGAEPEDDE